MLSCYFDFVIVIVDPLFDKLVPVGHTDPFKRRGSIYILNWAPNLSYMYTDPTFGTLVFVEIQHGGC